jgi:hypothetical protein
VLLLAVEFRFLSQDTLFYIYVIMRRFFLVLLAAVQASYGLVPNRAHVSNQNLAWQIPGRFPRRGNAALHPAVQSWNDNVKMNAHDGSSKGGLLKQLLVSLALAAATLTGDVDPSFALGPDDMKIELNVKSYQEITCPEELSGGRAGGAVGTGAGSSGIAQKCVEVVADVNNAKKEVVKDAAVFGTIFETKTGMSVLGNGQDGKNDAGQLAMIPVVPPGKTEQKFLFVAQQADDCKNQKQRGPQRDSSKADVAPCPIEGTKPLVALTFEKMKAVSYPGGDRFKLYDECEQNEFAEGCE